MSVIVLFLDLSGKAYTFNWKQQEPKFLCCISGVPHAEELYFQFGAPFMEETPCPDSRAVTCPVTWGQYQPWTEIDRNVSLAIMRLWADFARMQ